MIIVSKSRKEVNKVNRIERMSLTQISLTDEASMQHQFVLEALD